MISVFLENLKKRDIVVEINLESKEYEDVAFEAIRMNHLSFESVEEKYKLDSSFVLKCIEIDEKVLEFVDKKLLSDKRFILQCVEIGRSEILKFVNRELLSRKSFVIELVKIDGMALLHASEDLRDDKEVVSEAVKQNSESLQYAGDRMRSNEVVLVRAVIRMKDLNTLGFEGRDPSDSFRFSGSDLKKDKILIIELLKKLPPGSLLFKHVSDELKRDRKFCHKVVTKGDPLSLQYFIEEFRNDKEIVGAAVAKNGLSLHYASEGMRNDKDIVLASVMENGRSLEFASLALRCDGEVVIEAVKDGNCLQFASEELRSDGDIVKKAVTASGISLEFVSEELKNDEEIVMQAVRQNGLSLQFASNELKRDDKIVKAAVEKDGGALQYSNEIFKSDEKMVTLAVKNKPQSLQYASDLLRSDEVFVLGLMDEFDNLEIFQHCGPSIRNNREVVLRLIKEKDCDLFQYVSDELKEDKLVALEVVKQDGMGLQWAGQSVREDKDIVLEAVESDGHSLQFAGDLLRVDPEVVNVAIMHKLDSLKFAGPEIFDNKEIMVRAIKRKKWYLTRVGDKLRNDEEFILFISGLNKKYFRDYAGESLRRDRDFILTKLLKKNWRCFEYVRSKFRDDAEIAFKAVLFSRGKALQYASERLRDEDKGFMLRVLGEKRVMKHEKKYGRCLQYASTRLRNDRNFALRVIRKTKGGRPLTYIGEELMNEKSFLMEVLDIEPKCLEFFYRNRTGDDDEGDKDFILSVLRRDGMLIQYCSEEMKKDQDIICSALEQNVDSRKFIFDRRRSTSIFQLDETEDKKIVRSALKGLCKKIDGTDSKFRYEMSRMLGKLSTTTTTTTTKSKQRVLEDSGKLDFFKKFKTYFFERAQIYFELGMHEACIHDLVVHYQLLDIMDMIFPKSSDELREKVFKELTYQPVVEKIIEFLEVNEKEINWMKDEHKTSQLFSEPMEEEEIIQRKWNMINKIRMLGRTLISKQVQEFNKGLFQRVSKIYVDEGRGGGKQSPEEKEEEEEENEGEEEEKEEVFKYSDLVTDKVKKDFNEYLQKVLDSTEDIIDSHFNTREDVFAEGFGLFDISTLQQHQEGEEDEEYQREELKNSQQFFGFIDPKTKQRYGYGIEFGIVFSKGTSKKKRKSSMNNIQTLKNLPRRRVFYGKYENGKKHGNHCQEFSVFDGTLVFEGSYRNGKRSGFGYEYEFIKELESPLPVYTGEFWDGQRHGKGEMMNVRTGEIVKGIWDQGAIVEKKEVFYCPIVYYGSLEKHLKKKKIFHDDDKTTFDSFSSGYPVTFRMKTSHLVPALKNWKKVTHEIKDKYVSVKILKFIDPVDPDQESTTTTTTTISDHSNDIRKKKLSLYRMILRSIGLSHRFKRENQHKHILEKHGIIVGPSEIGVILKNYESSIDQFVFNNNNNNKKSNKVSVEEKIRIVYETSRGMSLLHSKGIIHPNLTWKNVLLSHHNEDSSSTTIKLSNFEPLREENEEEVLVHTENWRIFPSQAPGFVAPEVYFLRRRSFTKKSDVFRFGMMMYTLLFSKDSQHDPFISINRCSCGIRIIDIMKRNAIDEHVSKCNLRPNLEEVGHHRSMQIPQFLKDLINQCWNMNPLNRPSFEDITTRFNLFHYNNNNNKKKNRDIHVIKFHLVPERQEEEGEEEVLFDEHLEYHYSLMTPHTVSKLVSLGSLKLWIIRKFEDVFFGGPEELEVEEIETDLVHFSHDSEEYGRIKNDVDLMKLIKRTSETILRVSFSKSFRKKYVDRSFASMIYFLSQRRMKQTVGGNNKNIFEEFENLQQRKNELRYESRILKVEKMKLQDIVQRMRLKMKKVESLLEKREDEVQRWKKKYRRARRDDDDSSSSSSSSSSSEDSESESGDESSSYTSSSDEDSSSEEEEEEESTEGEEEDDDDDE